MGQSIPNWSMDVSDRPTARRHSFHDVEADRGFATRYGVGKRKEKIGKTCRSYDLSCIYWVCYGLFKVWLLSLLLLLLGGRRRPPVLSFLPVPQSLIHSILRHHSYS